MSKHHKEVIGNATLYLGDCLEILPRLGPVQMVMTDPPYGHNNNNGDLIANWEAALGKGKPGKARPIANDGAEANELFKAVLPELRRMLDPGACCCCCCGGGGGPDPQFARWSIWLNEVFDFKQMVVWDKGPMGMGWHYRRSYEVVLVGQKPGAACYWFDDSGKVENIIRPSAGYAPKIIPSDKDHPTPKPVGLFEHFIRLHTKAAHVVLDPFMGAGTTGVACHNQGRQFIGIELDRAHFEAACERIDAAQRQQSLFDHDLERDYIQHSIDELSR